VAIVLLFAIRGHWDSWKSNAVLQQTNDAYVAADQIPLSTRISGTVHRVGVQDYQAVKAGQVIVELDAAEFQATVDEARAAIDAARAELSSNQDAKRAADASTDAAKESVAETEAASEAAQASIDAEQAQVAQAISEFDRQSKLLANKAATREQYEQAEAARNESQAALQSKRADLTRSKAAIGASRAALAGSIQQRASLNAKDTALTAQIEAKTAALVAAKVTLNYTKIVAPADGRVGRLQVHPGQLLGAGIQVIDFVQNGSWVEANFLETQLARIRVGDEADVRIDAYPSQIFHGHVGEIAPASGSASALLPPDNATGNFTKVIQRVPVKVFIDGDPSQEMLRPGLSAEVTIHTDRVESQKHSTAAANQ
jgi:membrane fusion protein (multidrug efflux system)